MEKKYPGLLAAGAVAWLAYVVCVFTLGFSHWATKGLGVAYLVAWGWLLFTVWNRKNKRSVTAEQCTRDDQDDSRGN
ncbi:hypothetical protein [Sporosarcina koreensis]|uniref:hypothetical protein n=1 Tax=Sporosarcina koreensis TaxID=334735 RepID=UPI00058AF2BC|nr:hypothetical protein [Sporosarcina koreensis]